MDQNARIIRIRDPIHDLITFDPNDRLDALAWKLVNSREFQRLRRIKQLGFSELVFPGATHTRFSHCLGAFFIARKLLKTVEEKIEKHDKGKAFVAAIAALLHDVGHGPFSHVFEGVQKELGIEKRHEVWGSDIVQGETEIRSLLEEYDKSLARMVALLLNRKDPTDIYDSIVSSQFDADRLDYLQRDRYMAGTKTGAFDYAWLLDCLEIGRITVGQEGDFLEVDGLYLGNKGLAAAEGYLLARFHLYSQVYLHKTTRSAEKMLDALLHRLGTLVKSGDAVKSGLDNRHALLRLFKDQDLRSYIDLDDTSVWSGISQMTESNDATIRDLALRIRDRRLYKCFDAGELVGASGEQTLPRFKGRLKEIREEFGVRLLTDEVSQTAYGIHEYEDPGALQKVLIGRPDGTAYDDIAIRSDIIRSIQRRRVFRVYCGDSAAMERVRQVWREVAQ